MNVFQTWILIITLLFQRSSACRLRPPSNCRTSAYHLCFHDSPHYCRCWALGARGKSTPLDGTDGATTDPCVTSTNPKSYVMIPGHHRPSQVTTDSMYVAREIWQMLILIQHDSQKSAVIVSNWRLMFHWFWEVFIYWKFHIRSNNANILKLTITGHWEWCEAVKRDLHSHINLPLKNDWHHWLTAEMYGRHVWWLYKWSWHILYMVYFLFKW